jgi:hypothetical protein
MWQPLARYSSAEAKRVTALPRNSQFAILLLILLARPAAARAGSPAVAIQPKPSSLTAQQWREDVQFLARELPKRHASAFHHTPREVFEAEVAELDRRVDGLNADEIYVGLNRIANLVGDGHTFVEFPEDAARLPLQIRRFGDDYRMTATTRALEQALGARLLRIHETPVLRARELLLAMTPQNETPFLAQARVESFLTMGIALHGYRITPVRQIAQLTCAEDSGREFTVEARAMSSDAKPEWIHVFKLPPLYRQPPAEACWYTFLPEASAVYCNFRSYSNLGKHSAGLFKLVSEQHPKKLIIDMRQNGGGDYTLGLRYLVRPVRELPTINRHGHLFILIGPQTFSAAMSNAAHFRSQTAATLVGEPIGEKPNSYQESRRTKLPNSQLTLCYSVRYYKFIDAGENLIRPDQEIIPSWTEFKEGRDPVLEWVLKQDGRR